MRIYGNNTDFLHLTPLQSCFKFQVQEKMIGVCCLNSAWRCNGSSKDKNHILIGDKQIKDSLPFLRDCHFYRKIYIKVKIKGKGDRDKTKGKVIERFRSLKNNLK